MNNDWCFSLFRIWITWANKNLYRLDAFSGKVKRLNIARNTKEIKTVKFNSIKKIHVKEAKIYSFHFNQNFNKYQYFLLSDIRPLFYQRPSHWNFWYKYRHFAGILNQLIKILLLLFDFNTTGGVWVVI